MAPATALQIDERTPQQIVADFEADYAKILKRPADQRPRVRTVMPEIREYIRLQREAQA